MTGDDTAGDDTAGDDRRRRNQERRRRQRKTAMVLCAALAGWGIVVAIALAVHRLWPS